jgi:hypothetical protein
MKKLNRRQFSQLMMASTAVAIGIPIEQAVAEEQPKLLGLRVGPTKTTTKEDTDTKDEAGGDTEVFIQTIDPETGQTQFAQKRVIGGPPLVLRRDERIAGFAALSGASLLFSKTQGVPGSPEVVSRLTVVNESSQTLTVRGLEASNTIETLLITDGGVFSIISLNSGIPPFRLATIDAQTGAASLVEDFHFPPNERFSNITQCGNGTIYGTAIGTEGSVRLVQLDLQQRHIIDLQPLHFEERRLSDDLKSLTSSSSGQLYALADPKERGNNLLFKVDVGTGALHLVGEVDAEKITFSRA